MTRRDEILGIARRQFAMNGYQATSMRILAEASGLLAGSLYSHFRSKSLVVEEIVLGFYEKLIPAQAAALEGDGDGAEKLSRMIGAVYRVCADHHLELTILHYDWRVLKDIGEFSEVVRRSEETLQLWESAVAAGIADGSLRSGCNSRATMRVITSSIHGLLDSVRYDHPEFQVDPVDDGIVFLQELMLSGMRSSPRPTARAMS